MTIKLTIDRFENQKAVLKSQNGELVVFPKSLLPDNVYEGMVLYFSINENNKEEKEQEKKAKEILNEILQTGD